MRLSLKGVYRQTVHLYHILLIIIALNWALLFDQIVGNTSRVSRVNIFGCKAGSSVSQFQINRLMKPYQNELVGLYILPTSLKS